MPIPIAVGTALSGPLATLVAWIFKKAIIVFILTTSIFFLIDFLSPLVLRLAASYLGTNPLSLTQTLPASVWWFASAFKIDFGLKVLFSALATRFLIRRIPFIG